MDEKSLHTLEFHKILQRLAANTSFSGGEELARALRPTTNQLEAELWQRQTAEAVHLLDVHTNVTIGGTRDVRRAVDNAFRGFTLPPEDFLDVKATLEASRTLRRQLLKMRDDYPSLGDIADLIE